jgi:hypothetical protein
MQLDPGLISDIERKQFINDAINDLGSLGMFEKEVDVASVDGVVAVPNDYIGLIYVKWVDGRLLQPCRVQTNLTTGNPYGFVLNNTELELVPIPTQDDAVKMYYLYRPLKLVNDSDQPDIPNGYDSLLVDYAVAKAHRKNGNTALWKEYMNYYDNKKADLLFELTRRANSRVTRMYNEDDAPTSGTFPYKLI